MKKFLVLLALLIAMPIVAGIYYPHEVVALGLQLERARNGLSHETIVVEGETWYYLAGGPVDAPAVVMIHGFGADKDNWMRFSGPLSSRYRLIAPDLPGFGESARHDDWDYSLPRQVERLHAFLGALGIKKAHVVGNSMGGHITALYTHSYPQQVLSMGLFNNGGIQPQVENQMSLALKRGDNPLLVQSVEDFDRQLRFVMEHPPYIPPLVRRVIGERSIAQRDFNAYIFRQYKADRSSGLEAVLREIKTPTLILWGNQDRTIDVSVVNIMRPLLPHAEVALLDNTGHLPMIERPRQTAERYLDFIAKHD